MVGEGGLHRKPSNALPSDPRVEFYPRASRAQRSLGWHSDIRMPPGAGRAQRKPPDFRKTSKGRAAHRCSGTWGLASPAWPARKSDLKARPGLIRATQVCHPSLCVPLWIVMLFPRLSVVVFFLIPRVVTPHLPSPRPRHQPIIHHLFWKLLLGARGSQAREDEVQAAQG